MLKIRDLAATFEDRVVFRDVSFDLHQGEIGVLLGPSGSGKTTLLRVIAGLHGGKTTGKVEIGFKGLGKSPRGIGFVFQNLALFPHLTVEQNLFVSFFRPEDSSAKLQVQNLLEVFRIQHLKAKFPHEISGGEKQRVAVARALVDQPEIVLFDEPFSSLDPYLRRELRQEIFEILRSLKVTALMVTHDRDEAFEIADKVGILNGGQLLEWGPPLDIYHYPRHRFSADFLGPSSWLPLIKMGQKWFYGDHEVEVERSNDCSSLDLHQRALVRPESIFIKLESGLLVKVTKRRVQSTHIEFTLETREGDELIYRDSVNSDLRIQNEISIGIKLRDLVFL